MKVDRKPKAEKSPPAAKAVKSVRRPAPKTPEARPRDGADGDQRLAQRGGAGDRLIDRSVPDIPEPKGKERGRRRASERARSRLNPPPDG